MAKKIKLKDIIHEQEKIEMMESISQITDNLYQFSEQQKEMSVLLADLLTEVSQKIEKIKLEIPPPLEIQKVEVINQEKPLEEMKIVNPLEIKKPAWFFWPDFESIFNSLKTVVEKIGTKVFMAKLEGGTPETAQYVIPIDKQGNLLTPISPIIEKGKLIRGGSGSSSPPSSFVTGQITVAATATQLAANELRNGVILTARDSNTGNVMVGLSGVNTTQTGSGNGYILEPGGSVSVAVSNSNRIYVIGTASDVVSFIGS